jgi:hypothetical protein
MKTCAGLYVEIHVFFTLALAGEEWSVSRPSLFILNETLTAPPTIGQKTRWASEAL